MSQEIEFRELKLSAEDRQYIADREYFLRKLLNPSCQHDRLDEDGICRNCGADCRGM